MKTIKRTLTEKALCVQLPGKKGGKELIGKFPANESSEVEQVLGQIQIRDRKLGHMFWVIAV